MEAILDLENAGYALTVDGDTIRYTRNPEEPLPSNAEVWLYELRTQKAKAITFLQRRKDLAEMYDKVSKQLADAYPVGCIAWIEQNRPDLRGKIDMAELKANHAWLDCEDGKISVEMVKAALVEWYKSYRQSIIVYGQYLQNAVIQT